MLPSFRILKSKDCSGKYNLLTNWRDDDDGPFEIDGKLDSFNKKIDRESF